jgi:membrane protein insertase Oxa1/YidC/SpoIIIJ
MTKMQKIQPKLQKLQEKYKNDQQLLSQETMKLYKLYQRMHLRFVSTIVAN